jgi:formylglycine-generating enzyme required for sulfatase activity
VGSGELSRVALALTKQLEGPERRHSTSAPARSYPAELDIEMVFVEGGTFTMGCVPERDGKCQSIELPAHSVTVSSFYISKYEVTRAQWIAVMKDHSDAVLRNPGTWKDDDQLPIEGVSWEDIANEGGFLEWLNAQTGKNYRLITEAEWEYAARGGKHQSPYKYSGSDNIGEIAWYSGNAGSRTHLVGQKKPNVLGIYDMNGNVAEWCEELYLAYGSTGPSTSKNHVIRGDAWSDPENGTSLRVANRNSGSGTPNRRAQYFGIRVVLPAQ